MWALYDKFVAIVINVILLVFLCVFIKNGMEIYNQLHVSESEAVTGRFDRFGDEQEQ